MTIFQIRLKSLSHLLPPQAQPQQSMFRKSSLRLSGLVIFHFLYLIAGAFIFSAIESPEEANRISQLRNMRDSFLHRHPCVTAVAAANNNVSGMIYGRYEKARVRRVFGVRRSSFLTIFYVAFYILYLITGGFMFTALEAPLERDIRQAVASKRRKFLENHPCVPDTELEDLIKEVVKASDRGVSAANNVSGEPNWSFGQSLFFSSTVVTTIGYGHVTPLSKEGKIFCILYTLLGIPLTLILFTAMVERLMIPSTMFLQFLNSRLGRLYQPFNIRLLHFCIMATVLVMFFVLLPAAIFANLEPDWDYLDSLYYCFISLTTVGLGDYIPGDAPNQNYRPLYKVVTTGYLLVGLVFVMLALTIFYDIPQLNVGMLFMMQADERTVDPEKMRLKTSGSLGVNYSTDCHSSEHIMGEHDKMDTPSPEDTTPVHARP